MNNKDFKIGDNVILINVDDMYPDTCNATVDWIGEEFRKPTKIHQVFETKNLSILLNNGLFVNKKNIKHYEQ